MGGRTAGNGVTTAYNDVYATGQYTWNNRIDFGTMGDLFGRTDDYDYTLEIIADYTGFTDDDNYAYTGENTAYEGEGRWMHGGTGGPTRLGRWVDDLRTSSPNRLPTGQGMYEVKVTYYQGDHTALSSDYSRMGSYNTRGVSGIHNYTYSKTADGNGSATFATTLDGTGGKSFVPGKDLYSRDKSNGTSGDRTSVYEGNEATMAAYVMAGMAGTVYAIRAYDRALGADEVAQNRVADLCGYHGVDQTHVEAIDTEILAILIDTYGTASFTETGRDEIEKTIDDVLLARDAEKHKEQTEKYASLYAEGAKVLLMAFDPLG